MNHLLSRALNSLIKIHANKRDLDLLLKFITFLNLIKKATICSPQKLFVWPFKDCIVTSDFYGLRYTYYLPKGYDFNIYLNPYFHEYDVIKFVYHNLTTGDVFLDVGAHGGLYTLLAGKIVGPRGKVLSFEPNPINLILLRLNVMLNKLNNVIIIPKAVNDKAGKVTLYYSSMRTALTSSLAKAEKIIEVEATTIDDVIALNNCSLNKKFIKIMKIDVEGMDFKVLKGASNTLNKTYLVIVEQNTFEVRKLLLDKGFQITTLYPSGYLLAVNKNLGMDLANLQVAGIK